MFYTNLGSTNDKVNFYVVHKHMIIDYEMLAKEFEIDALPPKLMLDAFLIIRRSWPLTCFFPIRPLGKQVGKPLSLPYLLRIGFFTL